MAALAYSLLPVSGLLAFALARSERARFHGLQAIVLGAVWPVALYAASAVSALATRAVAGAGALVWVTMMVLTAVGRDVRLPLIGALLARAASADGDG